MRRWYRVQLTNEVRSADDLAYVFAGRDVTTEAEVAQLDVARRVGARQQNVLRL